MLAGFVDLVLHHRAPFVRVLQSKLLSSLVKRIGVKVRVKVRKDLFCRVFVDSLPDQQGHYRYKIDNSAAFNALIVLCLTRMQEALDHHVKVPAAREGRRYDLCFRLAAVSGPMCKGKPIAHAGIDRKRQKPWRMAGHVLHLCQLYLTAGVQKSPSSAGPRWRPKAPTGASSRTLPGGT
jgi:hypothetical protein